MKFKPGDKVRRIKGGDHGHAKEGGIYTVATITDDGTITLKESAPDWFYDVRYFIHLRKESIIPWL